MTSLRLFSDGLLSKWGFNDGDEPDDLWDYREAHGISLDEWHPVLIQLVRRYLLPKLEQDVTVTEISTIHNPIRAETVDGVDVSGYWYEDTSLALTPECVEIPFEEVLQVARETAASLPNRSTEDR